MKYQNIFHIAIYTKIEWNTIENEAVVKCWFGFIYIVHGALCSCIHIFYNIPSAKEHLPFIKRTHKIYLSFSLAIEKWTFVMIPWGIKMFHVNISMGCILFGSILRKKNEFVTFAWMIDSKLLDMKKNWYFRKENGRKGETWYRWVHKKF